jgi:hypothetical protein
MTETLAEYIQESMRSLSGSGVGRMTSPVQAYMFGPDFFRKQTYLQISDTFTATYGKKVWDALNNRTVFWNALRKVDWGPTVGWRIRSDRGSGRSRPVTETGTLPTIDVSAYQGAYSYPKIVGTTFGVSVKSQAVSTLEGGIGNQMAVEQEAASRDHIKEINEELLAGSAYLCSDGTTTTRVIGGSATTGWGNAKHFKVGDEVDLYDTGVGHKAETLAVSAASTANGTITVATGTDADDGDVVYIKSRAGITSIDDVVAHDSLPVGGAAGTAEANIDVYNLTTRPAAGYAAAANVSTNDGSGRDLTIALMDEAIRNVRINGGEPKLIVLGYDQYDRFNQLLQAQQRYADFQDFVFGVGDERTYPGTKSGMSLATYRGIPILPDPDVSECLSSGDVELGTKIYVLDTDYLEVPIMYPTQYLENGDYFAANAMVMRGLFFTLCELRALRLDVHSAIHDLNK